MLIWSMGNGCSEQRCGIQPGTGGPFDGAEPAEVRVEVLGGDAAELAHPALQPGVVRIDVLDMPGATYSHAGGDIDRVMLDAELATHRHHDRVSFGAENDVLGQDWAQPRNDMVRVVNIQNEVGRGAGAIACDQDRNLLIRQTALRCLAAALAGGPIYPTALTFAGAQKVRFISFGDTGKQLSAKLFGRGEKPMTPPKGRGSCDVQPLAGIGKRQLVTQDLRLVEPLATKVQMRQRCAGQDIEGARARTAQESRQATGSAILYDMLSSAMRARRTCRGGALDDLDRRQLGFRRQFLHHEVSLRARQSTQFRDQFHQFSLPHFKPPWAGAHAPQHQYGEVSGSQSEPVHINSYYSHSKTYLCDVFELLEPYAYVVCRLHPDCLETFENYDQRQETFRLI